MMKIVATTSLPAVYRPNGYARTTTAGTPHARAKNGKITKGIGLEKIPISNWQFGKPKGGGLH